VIVVLTFTGSLSVMEAGHAETRAVLLAALTCNLAWGIVDAALYLMSRFVEHARAVSTLMAVRRAPAGGAHALILDALPGVVSAVLTHPEVESLRERLTRLPEPSERVALTRTDWIGATAVCLLVFGSTLPVVVPFLLIHDPGVALRTSNLVALTIMFITGWRLGQHAGRPAWRVALFTVLIGVVLVAVTMALGG
jgi:VIT1/CCC1 family predicted Fe2+/Mn2+ transporter